MTARVFVDTNVLVYARDLRDETKQARALRWMALLWETRAGRLSHQVLQEYYVTMTRKLVPTHDAVEARADVTALFTWKPLAVDVDLFDVAWRIEDRFGLSWWDALIVAAAERSACSHLLTEDLQDGQRIGSVEIIDPFRHAPEDVLGE